MRIVIAPDSFKGSLSAAQAAAAMAEGVRRVFSRADILILPLADGGEGTLDALLTARGGEYRPFSLPSHPHAAWGRLPDGSALIESAQAVGITLPGLLERPVWQRDSSGVGVLLRAALDAGCRCLRIGLGGSATNDGGAGVLAALGVRLLDEANRVLSPAPEGLERLAALDVSGLDPRLRQCDIQLLSDVDNPLCGAQGATAVYGPQKGVAPPDVVRLDGILGRWAALCETAFGQPGLSGEAGTGAAGGMGFALRLLGARYASGAEAVLDALGFDEAAGAADWVLTGEGRGDAQTLSGKAPIAVARRAKRLSVPVALLCGSVDEAARPALLGWFASVDALAAGDVSIAEARINAARWLALAAERRARAFAQAQE